MISCGMGRNSIAMILLMFGRGEIMPVVFCDTGAEMPETYEYLEYFQPWLKKKYGQEIIVLSSKQTPELYSKDTRRDILTYYLSKKSIPLLMNRACTDKFKHRPMNKWKKLHGITEDYMGIDAGEAHRAADRDLKYFPLVQEGIDLQGCINIIKGVGLDIPVKSGCYFCPFQGVKGFRALKRAHPDLFQKAMILENTSIWRRRAEGKSFAPLIPTGPALSDIDKQGDMFAKCDFSEITPCMCTL
ncbi:hypothetical protein LCGC14_2800300 [marine sediment metagenome]|uniref:Phosphoadenosine phosphosulphate reductase domain-containing protein n=1 Tax=marine sediment metagenome TaxID=412755 RepID=A0A0F8YMZ6_9ZZZZ